ncbi:hypothetical protein EZV62_028204 [Acer yangbiense]|uniref:Uncharacterized protein n=1 Tax=Acer yangbiense TaxID=1000413 RepID=A0A5C7GP08_9ROSI|nr:hypothetical protein EZV62_028204 [Acer yangbiense]
MAFDSEVAARVEEQTRGCGEQCTHTKRSKSKASSMDALEARMTNLEDTLSEMQANLSDDITRITNAPKLVTVKSPKRPRPPSESSKKAYNSTSKPRELWMTQHGSPMLPPSFGNLPNYGGDANMVTPSILSPHGMNSIGNSKKQFSPTDAEKEARGCLHRLKQSGSIHDYVKEFTTLTFEIEDLSDKDQHFFFFFMDGLKDWARVELERQNVQDLGTAIADTESPTDLTRSKESKYIHGEGGDKPKDNDRKDDGRSKSPDGNNRRDRPNGGKPTVIKSKSSCFICDEPYWVHDCPKRKMLNARVT